MTDEDLGRAICPFDVRGDSGPELYRRIGAEARRLVTDDRIVALEAENAALARKVYVPGLWRCPKCNFELLQSNLNAADGTVTARDTPGDKCPNCDGPLWRVTERERHHSLMKDCVRWWVEKQEAVRRLSAADAENGRLRELLRRWCRAPEITEIGAEDRDRETEKVWSESIAALGDDA